MNPTTRGDSGQNKLENRPSAQSEMTQAHCAVEGVDNCRTVGALTGSGLSPSPSAAWSGLPGGIEAAEEVVSNRGDTLGGQTAWTTNGRQATPSRGWSRR